jgi:sialate O-acetylesterase
MDMNRPANCYAGTLAPLAGLAVKGAIWHQGYNNALVPNGHMMYNQVFPEMIKAWRTVFNDPTMPFGIISQETDGDPQSLENFLPRMVDEGTYIRESHYQTFLKLRNAGDKTIGYASSFDQHRAWFHPQIKIPVGERIACWALATQYGKNIQWLPPQVKEVKPDGGKLVISLDNDVHPYNDGPILGFAIAGKDGHFQPAQAQWVNKNEGKPGAPVYDHKIIVLTSPLVPEPLYFRHAWARNPMENLKNSGVPFACQRNDTWSLADMYEIYTGKKPKVPGVTDGVEHRELIKAMQADDLKRRLEEAKTLLKTNGVKTID